MRAGAALALLVSAACTSPATEARRTDGSIVIGESARIWSRNLSEERRLFVRLPPRYERSRQAYPVLYLLDAESQFEHAAGVAQFLSSVNRRIPEMILIGVTNSRRVRDLTPPARDAALRAKLPDAGGADAFLAFLAEELVPWVDARYRTAPYRILVGHSFGGLFCAYALAHRPTAFQAHVAISPSLWWDQGAAARWTEEGIRNLGKPPWLFLSWGDDEPLISRSTSALVEALQARPVAGLRWAHRYYPGDDHMSTPHRSLYDALELLYAGWRMRLHHDEQPLDVSLEDVEAHYAALTERFGYQVRPTADALGAESRTLMNHGNTTAALDLLRRNVREYPESAAIHRALGAALEKLGRREEALQAYEQALTLAVDDESAYENPIEIHRGAVERLGKR